QPSRAPQLRGARSDGTLGFLSGGRIGFGRQSADLLRIAALLLGHWGTPNSLVAPCAACIYAVWLGQPNRPPLERRATNDRAPRAGISSAGKAREATEPWGSERRVTPPAGERTSEER